MLHTEGALLATGSFFSLWRFVRINLSHAPEKRAHLGPAPANGSTVNRAQVEALRAAITAELVRAQTLLLHKAATRVIYVMESLACLPRGGYCHSAIEH